MGKISFGSMESIDVNINGWVDCCNPVWDGGEGTEGELREESAQCRGSLSGMDYRDAEPGLVLGSGGRPGLEGEPRVQKWPVGPILTQRGLSLDHRSAAAQNSHWGRQTTKGSHTHTHTHKTHRNMFVLHLIETSEVCF